METGLRPATAQLENRQRHFRSRLLSLPEGDQSREVVGAASWIGKKLQNENRKGRNDSPTRRARGTGCRDEPGGRVVGHGRSGECKAGNHHVHGRVTTRQCSNRVRSRMAERTILVGHQTHMSYSQEAYDAECAGLARTIEEAVKRQTTPEQVTICTDAQAAVKPMLSDDSGPAQMNAIQARRRIEAL
jgi:hypothetical protein